MSQIQKVVSYDPRITAPIPQFNIVKSFQNIYTQEYAAVSQNASSHNYQISVGSLDTIVDRQILWSSSIYLQMTVTIGTTTKGAPVLVHGVDFASKHHPLTTIFGNLTATINGSQVKVNPSEVMNEVLRLVDFESNREVATTPSALDVYLSASDGSYSSNDIVLGFWNSEYQGFNPNGAFPNLTFTDPSGNDLAGTSGYYTNSSGTTHWYKNGIPVQIATCGGSYSIFVKMDVVEPLMISPFIYADKTREAQYPGLHGVNSIQVQASVDSTAVGRMLRSAQVARGSTISAVSLLSSQPFSDSKMIVTFLQPAPDYQLPPVCITPIFDVSNVYRTASSSVISASGTKTITSSAVNLPYLPHSLLIFAKPTTYSANTQHSEWLFPIENLSLNFDGNTNVLRSFSKEQLYNIAKRNGVNTSYQQWVGQASIGSSTAMKVSLCGAPLVLKAGRDFQYRYGSSPGTGGSFQMSMSVTVRNRTTSAAYYPELYIIPVYAGFLKLESGGGELILAPINQNDVINTEYDPDVDVLQRMVGNGKSFWGDLGSTLLQLAKNPAVKKMIKQGARSFGGPIGSLGVEAAESMGYGRVSDRLI